MSRCRGVLISAATNTCRTLMTEAILRHMTGARLSVVSGGLAYNLPISAHVSSVLREIGINGEVGPSQGISRLIKEQGKTFDVMVSFNDDHEAEHGEDLSEDGMFQSKHGNLINSDGVPAHWTVVSDSGNVARKWTLWSPRNPAIEHENSVRKFQDHLYRGEPLFSERHAQSFRSKLKISQRWQIRPVVSLPMERPYEVLDRHREVRDAITLRCLELVEEIEDVFEEKLLTDAARRVLHHPSS